MTQVTHFLPLTIPTMLWIDTCKPWAKFMLHYQKEPWCSRWLVPLSKLTPLPDEDLQSKHHDQYLKEMTLVRQMINVRAYHSATVTNNTFHDTFPSLGCEIISFCNICSLCMYNQGFHYFLKVEGPLRLSRKSWTFLVWEVAFPYHLKRVMCSKCTD